MKPFTSLLSVLFLSLSLLPADEIEDRIKVIRADYNATESAKDLTSKTIEIDDGGIVAKLTRYENAGELVKLVYTSGSDHGGATDYFYFKNGELYFIYQSQGYWSFDPKGGEGATIDTGREQRLYFNGDQVIRHLAKEVKTSDPNAVSKLLSETENQSIHDPEAATGLRNAAERLKKIRTEAELERYLYEE